jgi:hypothetical protein
MLPRPVLPGIELLSRLCSPARHDDGAHIGRLEHPERRVGEVVGQLGQFEAEPQIRLIRAEAAHRVCVRHPRDRRRQLVADKFPDSSQHLLSHRDDVIFGNEAHLKVQLSELRLPVSPEILIAVAAGDLEVPFHPADH